MGILLYGNVDLFVVLNTDLISISSGGLVVGRLLLIVNILKDLFSKDFGEGTELDAFCFWGVLDRSLVGLEHLVDVEVLVDVVQGLLVLEAREVLGLSLLVLLKWNWCWTTEPNQRRDDALRTVFSPNSDVLGELE